MSPRALVTGGAGFIGSHLVQVLTQEGFAVRVLDDLSAGSLDNLGELPAEFVRGSILDRPTLKQAIAGCEIIFHNAALISVPQSIKHPGQYYDTNVTGTFNVFDLAQRSGVRRVVYASSAAVYGHSVGVPLNEASAVSPTSPYGATKLINELQATILAQDTGMDIVGLRFMNVYGPRQRTGTEESGVIAIFCHALVNDRPLIVHGDGEQTRDFIFVDDAVRASLLAARMPGERLRVPGGINVGSGHPTSIRELVEIFEKLTGQRIRQVRRPERPHDIKHSFADISLARELLRFEPGVNLADGIRDTLDWFREMG